jgi:uncharacterized protein YdaU (DUF1376 family)
MDAMNNLPDDDGSGKTPFMRFWISDWQSSVVLMNAAQRGAHISMLAYSWERGGCPTDLTLLKRITGEIDDADLRVVLERWEIVNGQYINPRQERERADVRLRHEKAVRGARRRWSHAQPMLEPCSTDAQWHAQTMLDRCSSDAQWHAKPMLDRMLKPCSSDAAQSLRISESQSPRDSDAHSPESQKHNQPRRLRRQAVSARGVITFDFETATFAGISDETIKAWTEAYPAVDVNRTILRSAEWLLANPKKRKKNYNRFLTSWLSRSQERGGDRLPTHNTTTAVPEHLRF